MTERGIVHELCNDFIHEVEQNDLIKMYDALASYTPKSYWWHKTNDEILMEMNRIYTEDEDHEEAFIDRDKFDRWMKGDDNAWDEK